jgi:uncharacterized protein
MGRCPTCRAEAALDGNPHRPFCSERCAMVDLSGWLGERFRIPGDPVPDTAEPADDPQPPEPKR